MVVKEFLIKHISDITLIIITLIFTLFGEDLFVFIRKFITKSLRTKISIVTEKGLLKRISKLDYFICFLISALIVLPILAILSQRVIQSILREFGNQIVIVVIISIIISYFIYVKTYH